MQCFSNHRSRPKTGSPRLCGWVAKACKLPHLKDLRAQDLINEEIEMRFNVKTPYYG